MIYKVFAIFDSAVGAYLPPLHFRSLGEALRSFEGAVLEEGSQFRRNASDYSLFELGEWDDSTALYQTHLTPFVQAKAHEIIARQASAA